MDFPVNTSFCLRLPRGILLVMGAFTMVAVRVRVVSWVVLASLVAPSWISPRTTFTVFRLLRGTLLVMGATKLVQLTPASWVLTCTSVRTGLRVIPSLSLLKTVSSRRRFFRCHSSV